MAFAILRIGKISSAAKAQNADSHNERKYDVKNADIDKRHLNGEYVKVDQRPSWELANDRIEAMGIKPKADAVRLVEFLLTASPEFFNPGEDIRHSAYFQANLQFMQKRYGANLVSFTLHQDETTPHFQCMVVPITSQDKTVTLKNGQPHTRKGHRLTAGELFTKSTLRQLQTDYADAMASFGLSRGAEKSPTKHQAIKRVYGLNRQVHELDEIARQSSAIKQEVVELTDQRQDLTLENQRLSQLLAEQNRQIAQLSAQRDDQQKKAESLAQSVATLNAQQTALTNTVNRLTTDKANLTTEANQQRQQMAQISAQKNDLLQQTTTLNLTVTTLRSQKNALESTVKQLSQEKVNLTSDVKTLTIDNARLLNENELQRQNLDYLQKKANLSRKELGQETKPVQQSPKPPLKNQSQGPKFNP